MLARAMSLSSGSRPSAADLQPLERVLRWRAQRWSAILAQVVAFGALCWAVTGATAAISVWAVAVAVAGGLDVALSRAQLARLDDPRLNLATSVSRAFSASAFNAIALIMATHHAPGAIGAALLLGCATNLNNVMMTRGSWRCALTLVVPSFATMLAVPLVAKVTGVDFEPKMLALIELAVVISLSFTVRLASTLYKEGEVIREARDVAVAADRSKSAFLANVSHEIRTPLNGVLGMAQAMRRDPLSAVQRDRLEVINASGQALLAILNDVLDFSKIEAGKLELELVDFDLEEIARGAHATFTPIAEGKGLAFELAVEADAQGAWRGDSVRVRQVLYNLISNAVKFTAEGKVVATLSRSESGVRIVVADTGIGIAPDRAAALFEKFVQADATTTRRFGGTGLGLAICKELCEAMGGSIRVASRLGEGSAFTVDLPLPRAAQAEHTPARPVAAEAALEEGLVLRVLAAEDNPTNQLVLKTLLGQIGVEPVMVGDGAAAVAAWAEGPWDLILMDMQMPVMDGLAATAAIRRREAELGLSPTPIVALTADAMSHQVEAYRVAGMNGFLAKPIEVAELFRTIQRVADGVGSEEAAAAPLLRHRPA